MESFKSHGSTPRPSRASSRSDMSDVTPALDVSSSFATMASQEDWGISKKMSFRDPLASTSSSVPGSPDSLSLAASSSLSVTKAPPSSAEASSSKVFFQIGDNLKKLIAESEVLQTLSSKCIEKTRQLFDEATVRQMREEIYLVLPDRAKEAHDELLHAYTTGGIAKLVELACQMSIPLVRQLAQKLVDWCKWLADHREELAGALAGVYETARAAILQLQYRLMTEVWRNLHALNFNTKPQRPLVSSPVCLGGDYRSPQYIFHAASRRGWPPFQASQSPYFTAHPYDCYTSSSNLSTRSASPKQLHLPGKEKDGDRALPAAGFSIFSPLASGERYTGDEGDDTNTTPFHSRLYAAVAPANSQQKFFEARGDGDAALIAAVSSGLATPIATYRGMPPCLECRQSLLPGGGGWGSLVASQLVPVQGLSKHTVASKSEGAAPPVFGFARGAKMTDGPEIFEKGGAASGFLASRTSEQLVVFSVSTN